jgi:Copper amine oxidase N-terminal domain.
MRYSIIIIFSLSLINADIHVFNRSTGTQSHIKTLSNSKPLYISAKDIGNSFTSKVYENSERQKIVLYISGSKIKISGNSSYIIVNDDAYQMPQKTLTETDDLYVPAKYFFDIIKATILPGINFDSMKELLEIDIIRFNITDIKIDVKSNGTIIHLATRKTFPERNISSFINKHGRDYITIPDGVIDTL